MVRDDGPEFRSKDFQLILRKQRYREEVTAYGQPFDNSIIERFHTRMTGELLNMKQFETLTEAREKISDCIEEYNTQRRHSSLGNKTSLEVWKEEF